MGAWVLPGCSQRLRGKCSIHVIFHRRDEGLGGSGKYTCMVKLPPGKLLPSPLGSYIYIYIYSYDSLSVQVECVFLSSPVCLFHDSTSSFLL